MTEQKQFEFKPLGRKLLIRKTGKVEVWEGKILTGDVAKDAPLLGEIVDAGLGEFAEQTGEWMDTQVKTGEKVVFLEGTGATIRSHGEELLLLMERDILGTY